MVRSRTSVSRRGFLLGSLGAGVAATQGCAAPRSNAAGSSTAQAGIPESLTEPPAPSEPVTVEAVHSPARNANVQLITMRPAGVGGRIPVCLALHGRGSSAQTFLDLGVPEFLNQAVAAGVKPFGVVSVDGGDTYWVAKKPEDDPQKMLVEDVPTWLSNRGFGAPFAALGISMGGYGALNYARTPGLNAVAAISAAMFLTWAEAKTRNAFTDERSWQATEPLRNTDKLGEVQLGVWCGTSDPFITQARQLIDKTHPKVAAIGPGEHADPYWRRVFPDVLRFIGESVP
jgi:S-formylglutathione hydrolase FrmB